MLEEKDSEAALPETLVTALGELGRGDVVATEMLNGGVISLTRRVVFGDGSRLVVKQSTQAPPDLYALEAEGLDVLRATGVRVPEVHGVAAEYLLLEDLATPPDAELDWEALGRAMGTLHSHHGERFGFHHDNYLGLLTHHNDWMDDGHEFFARYRILHFLEYPNCERSISLELRGKIERLAAKLPELIPVQPPSLLHGDFWVMPYEGTLFGNVVIDSAGTPALVDPAVYYGWAEADLGMFHQYGGTPDSPFYGAYLEVNPLEPGWEDRLPILHIREWLSIVEHFGPDNPSTAPVLVQIEEMCDRYL